MLPSIGVKSSTSANGSQPSGNTKKDKIQQTPSSTQKNKVEAYPRTFKSSLKNKKCVVEPKGTENVQHSKLNANSDLLCVKCNGCMLFDNHDLCVLNFINDVNAHPKSKFVKKSSKRKKPRKSKTNVPVSKPNIIQSTSANNKEPNKSWGSIVYDVPSSSLDECRLSKLFSGTVKFRNDHVAKILGYGDYQIGNVMILRAYYVEGLGHNLFFVRQFCNLNLEVAFRQHTCFISNLEGIDLLTRSRGNNLYTLSLGDMIASYPICLLSKASKTKSWLWHQRLSHLNFGAINHLARHCLVRGLPKLKFEKDHLCSACAMGKSKKKPYKPKSEDTNQEKLYLLHMDLCGPMHVASVNGKKYILVIVDDYSRFTWVKCLRSKDEASDFIIKFFKMIQLRLKHLSDESEQIRELNFLIKLCVNIMRRRIIETIHVDFDELTAMASEHNSLEPVLYEMTSATISSGLVPNTPPSTPYVPPSRTDWDILFQPLFNELLNPPPSIDPPVPEVIAPNAIVVARAPTESISPPSSKIVDKDTPSPSNSQTLPETQSPVISIDVEEENHDLDVAHINNNPFFGILIPENIYESSSSDVIPIVVHTAAPNSEHVNKWTTNHPLNNIIDELERPELVPRPDKVMVITLKWTYKVKLDELGGILKNKARLVTRGYRQEEGIDFEESFAPVA
ncbi:retrovirus-related pol polyprotein from transposon TNT 1-94 [Tanacetum coccineum]